MSNNTLNNYYHLIEVKTIEQNEHVFFSAVIDANIIKDMFTVSPAEYTISNQQIKFYRAEDGFDIDADLIDRLKESKSSHGYQRFFDSKKLDGIKSYVSDKNEYNIIPNSIILSVDAKDEVEEISALSNLIAEESLEFIFLSKEKYSEFYSQDNASLNLPDLKDNVLLIPKKLCELAKENYDFFDSKYKPILVIDGNHRLLGIREFLKTNTDKFEIVVSMMINSDIKDEAQIFTTINTNAKPVNPSYYYQIMGEFNKGNDLDEHIFLHYLTRLFNETSNSPLYYRIKMLGKPIKDAPYKQSISQAFFIDQLYDWLFSPKRVIKQQDNQILKAPIFDKLFKYTQIESYKEDKLELFIIKFLVMYFTVHKELYNKKYNNTDVTDMWNFSFDSVIVTDRIPLLKTLGIGALIELIPTLYILLMSQKALFNEPIILEQKNDVIKRQFDILRDLKVTDIESLLAPIYNGTFSLKDELGSEEFRASSGQGSLKKLAQKIFENSYSNTSINEIMKNYKNWYERN